MTRGIFITFEGGDGAGKTTLIQTIARFLEEKKTPCLTTREPGGTLLGEKIRDLLLDPTLSPVSPYAELALFLASRAQHILEVIHPALLQKKIVLCDRFNDSSIAYQGVGRNLGTKEVGQACQFFSQGLIPDLTFYLDIDPELALQRTSPSRNLDRIEKEGLSFQIKIRNAYHELAEKAPDRIVLLDATLSPTDLFEQALKALIEIY